ncbi:uncharacterized protein LOC143448375 isoform X2 [Clavelina lepadiformis]|uniref:uncharacterized protein LOC143448375 isoform X2 n=1 Tax=Clavelina lepadiformis TaxID=159417 RepID=UPI004041FD8D
MADNSQLYRNDSKQRSEADAILNPRGQAASQAIAYGQPLGDGATPALVASGRIGQEVWDQSVSYCGNLYSKYRPVQHSNAVSRASWGDKHGVRSTSSGPHRAQPPGELPVCGRGQGLYHQAHPSITDKPSSRHAGSPLVHGASNSHHYHTTPTNLGTAGATPPSSGVHGVSKDKHSTGRMSDVTALFEATRNRSLAEIKHLLGKGVDVNSVENGSGSTALHVAAKAGDAHTVEYLLKCGADHTIRDRHKQTPAQYYNHVDEAVQGMCLGSKKATSLVPSQIDWRKSYSGETSSPGPKPFYPDMSQRNIQQSESPYPGAKHSSLHQGLGRSNLSNVTQPPRYSPSNQAKTKEDGHGKSRADRHTSDTITRRHDHFPHPFDYISRPKQSDYNSPIDNPKHPQLPVETPPVTNATSKPAVNGSKTNSWPSEHGGHYTTKTNDTSMYSRADAQKSYEHPKPHQKYGANIGESKGVSSFSIDDITRPVSTTPTHHRNTSAKAAYPVQQPSKRQDPSSIPLAISTAHINPAPYAAELYSRLPPHAATADIASHYATSMTSPLKLPPHYPYYPHEALAYPISRMMYPAPRHHQLPGLAAIPSFPAKDLVLQSQHEQQLLSKYDSKSIMQSLSDVHKSSPAHVVAPDNRHRHGSFGVSHSKDSSFSQNDMRHYSHHHRDSSLEKSQFQRNYQPLTIPSHSSRDLKTNSENQSHQPQRDHHTKYHVGKTQASHADSNHTVANSEHNRHADKDRGQLAQRRSHDTDIRPYVNNLSPQKSDFSAGQPITEKSGRNSSKCSPSSENSTSRKPSFNKHPPKEWHTSSSDTSRPDGKKNFSEKSVTERSRKSSEANGVKEIDEKSPTPPCDKALLNSKTSKELKTSKSALESSCFEDMKEVSKENVEVTSGPQMGKRGRKRKLLDQNYNQNSLGSNFDSKQDLSRTMSSETETLSRREKRPRKSETDEYLYGWVYDGFSSSEPENDDSSDEDFHCPSSAVLQKGSNRHTSLRSSGHLSQVPSIDDVTQERRRTGRKPGRRGRQPKRKISQDSESPTARFKRKHHRSRKLSSESASSLACQEKLSSDLDESDKSGDDDGMKHLKQTKVTSDKDDEELEKKTKGKLKGQKRAYKNFEHALRKKKGVKRPDLHLKKLDKLGNRKSSKTKDDKGHKNQDKHERKKKRKLKKTKFNDSESATVTSSSSPRPVSSKDLQVPNHSESVDPVACINPAVCPALIELYTGKPVLEVDNLKITPTDTKTCVQENPLFSDELTASEAKALSDALKNTNILPIQDPSVTTSPQHPKNFDHARLNASLMSNKSEKDSKCPKPKLVPPELQKVAKKRGRKPKSLQDPKDNKLKSLKLSKSNAGIITTPKPYSKLSGIKKAADMKGKSLYPPRKGRPPGSVNKNSSKLKKDISKKKSIKQTKKAISQISVSNDKVASPEVQDTLLTVESAVQRLQTLVPPVQPLSEICPSPSTPHKHLHTPNTQRAFTPINFLKERKTHSSPLPPNMKKLTGNSAIGQTPLHKAAKLGYVENVEYYLEQGFEEANTKDNAGYSALHEACARGNLEAARLLLEFGADVNLNADDGTRPIHDAVEYDHVELTRLLLACGADPMLSKFSGRAIKNMIRSKEMGNFINAYLKELQPLDEQSKDDPALNWTFPSSSLLEGKHEAGYDPLAYPPSDDEHCGLMDFELYREAPPDSFLIQPSKTANRANYYLLDDVLRMKRCSMADFLLENPVDIKTMLVEDFKREMAENWAPRMFGDHNVAGDFVEIIPASKKVIGNALSIRVCNGGKVSTLPVEADPPRKSKPIPHGAFDENWYRPVVTAPVVSQNYPESVPEPADIPCCSHSSFQSESCDSPPPPTMHILTPDAKKTVMTPSVGISDEEYFDCSQDCRTLDDEQHKDDSAISSLPSEHLHCGLFSKENLVNGYTVQEHKQIQNGVSGKSPNTTEFSSKKNNFHPDNPSASISDKTITSLSDRMSNEVCIDNFLETKSYLHSEQSRFSENDSNGFHPVNNFNEQTNHVGPLKENHHAMI